MKNVVAGTTAYGSKMDGHVVEQRTVDNEGQSEVVDTTETESEGTRHTNHALEDYRYQLMLLEQQKKKRALLASEGPKGEGNAAPMGYHGEGESVPKELNPADIRNAPRDSVNNNTGPSAAFQDFQMQLMLLEQQNKRRLLMVRANMEAALTGARASTGEEAPPNPLGLPHQQSQEHPGSASHNLDAATTPSPLPTDSPQRLELSDHEKQLELLAQRVEKRLGMTRSEQGTTEARDSAPTNARHAHPISQAQKDYYAQLAILDEQNKKRLEAAAREDSKNSQGALHRSSMRTSDLRHRCTSFDPEFGPHGESKDRTRATPENACEYTRPFCGFLRNCPTVFHAVENQKEELLDNDFAALSEREKWDIVPGGKYFVERNGSALIAFVVGGKYKAGNGAAIVGGHVDALTAKVKPVSQVPNKAGYLQLGVAPYAGGMNSTWWDRDLGIGGRVLVKQNDKIVSRLVKLDNAIARIPTLAPHFGAAAVGPFNPETQMVPIIGLESPGHNIENVHEHGRTPCNTPTISCDPGTPIRSFVSKQPPVLVRAVGDALGLGTDSYGDIVNWELELFDVQPATVGGLNNEFIYGGRLDDKLCSWSAMQALLESAYNDTENSSIVKVVGWFDNEEIGSGLRQGARGNFLPSTIERAVTALSPKCKKKFDLIGRTYANSFLLSADVTHAVNPNFLNAYLENHAPRLNVGLAVSADPNGHMTTDAISTAILERCAERVGAKLQVFQIRNDSRSGGTIGPMLSAATGMRAIDAGIPQLSMHSIRATTGALDPGLGALMFQAFFDNFESVDKEFQY